MLSFRHSIDKISSCVCPTGTTLDSGKVIISLIAVRLQIAIRESVRKCNCVIFGSGFCIVIQNDRRQSIFAGAEHPHERICFRISFRLIQNLNPCFIGHKVFSTQKLPVKMIIHRFEVMIGTIDDLVGKCCTGKRNSELLPILFLPVLFLLPQFSFFNAPLYFNNFRQSTHDILFLQEYQQFSRSHDHHHMGCKL